MASLLDTTLTYHRSTFVRRLGMGAFAFVGTAAYVASFTLVSGASEIADVARRVGVCAGLSWILFGALLLVIGRELTIGQWIDICLSTMAIGILVMTLGMSINALADSFVGSVGAASSIGGIQATVLLAADIAMGLWFMSRAARARLGWGRALLAWVLGLNGIFLVMMIILP